ncbi:MAG: ATP phosphoribosyltransferase regulatory subunit [Hyphomonadaceae bacterium]|nr:ATP phosphoribosyltransferase regulatory subunit [Clostridia bacterium]
MLKWKNHTPDGVQDILSNDCIMKKGIEESVTQVFYRFGYLPVESPTLEYYDVFASQCGAVEQETMFKFFDHQGRILVLRPDLTTPIARMMGTKCDQLPLPARLCYVGNAFRNNPPNHGVRLKEITQAGIELIGQDTPEADAEIIAVAINALLAAGLKEFQIEIGQVAFFKGLMEQAGLEDALSEELRSHIDAKDALAVEELLKETTIEPALKQLIMDLPALFGGIEILDRVQPLTQNPSSISALAHLKAVYEILLDYGLEKYISVDLGMVQRLNYYTGMIFRGFTYGVGFPICTGGRYDGLIQVFGEQKAAMGAAIEINGLMSALKRQNQETVQWHSDSLISYGEQGRKTAFLIANELRLSGLVIEMTLSEMTEQQLIAYGEQRKIGGIITVTDAQNIALYNLQSGERVQTTLAKLLGEGVDA